jgi:hypothetical protein
MSEKENITNTIIEKKGIFGFGLSHNNNLDFMTIVVLAFMGIIIKLFFPERYTRFGNAGPATSTIWGYGLTAIALSIMIFMGIYFTNTVFENQGNFISILFSNVTPIFLTLLIIIYTIALNFIYFTRINSNKVTLEYHTYSAMSSVLTIVQIFLVSTYLYYFLVKKTVAKNSIQIDISQNAVYILSIINFMFLMMIHISLEFFATDETPLPPKV